MNTLRRHLANGALEVGLLAPMVVPGTGGLMAQSLAASVEDAVRESDAIVLGKVTKTDPQGIEIGSLNQLITRHSFVVETWYKGSSPREISVLTPGGFCHSC